MLSKAILASLKQKLRTRGLTYRQLASDLGVAELTVKRWLNKENLALDALERICEAAEIPMEELVSQAAREQARITYFTPTQDEAFAREPWLLAYFAKLAYGRRSPREIEGEHALSRASTVTYLARLEALGLIRRLPQDKVRLLVKPPFGFAPGSRNLKIQGKELMESLTRSFENGETVYAFLKVLALSTSELEGFATELTTVLMRHSALSETRGAGTPDSAFELAVLMAPFKSRPEKPLPELAPEAKKKPK